MVDFSMVRILGVGSGKLI